MKMPKHTALGIVGCVGVACRIASAVFSDALWGIIHDLSVVQTMYMVHRMTDDDTQAMLVLKHTVGLCIVLDNGLRIGQYASLVYAVYLSFLVADAVVYHLVFLGLVGLFTVLGLPLLSDVCKLCLLISVYDMAEEAQLVKDPPMADAA